MSRVKDVFQDLYFKSSQMHGLTITYQFEHANHAIQGRS